MMRDIACRNVIGVETAKQALISINEELKGYEIDKHLINLEGVYGQEERTQMDDLWTK